VQGDSYATTDHHVDVQGDHMQLPIIMLMCKVIHMQLSIIMLMCRAIHLQLLVLDQPDSSQHQTCLLMCVLPCTSSRNLQFGASSEICSECSGGDCSQMLCLVMTSRHKAGQGGLRFYVWIFTANFGGPFYLNKLV
jgi:hypothetical protein